MVGTVLGTACAILGHPKTLVEGNKSQAEGSGTLCSPLLQEQELSLPRPSLRIKKPPRREKREPPPREN